MASIIEEIHLIKTDVNANNNKFWVGKLYDDDTLETSWGRVGDQGQSKTYTGGGKRMLDKKRREKEHKGYSEIDIISDSGGHVSGKVIQKESLSKVAKDQIQTKSPETKQLIDYLAQVNIHNILSNTTLSYDAEDGLFKTPMGIVSAATICEAKDLLEQISVFIVKGDFDGLNIKKLTGQYLMRIPQKVSRRLKVTDVFPDQEALKKQNDILDSLTASLDMVLNAPKKKSTTSQTCNCCVDTVFKVKLDVIKTAREISEITKLYEKTLDRGYACGHLAVKTVYTVELEEMRLKFDKDQQQRGRQNVWRLWHGTRASNLLSILKNGLIIPPRNAGYCTGRMFGNGIYFSDQSSKSLNYSYGYWAGKTENNCFMFLADVNMGKYWTPSHSMSDAHDYARKNGFDSCYAQANKSSVRNNEMIVYSTQQVNLVYLIEFAESKKGRW